jgi:hypothetical protein
LALRGGPATFGVFTGIAPIAAGVTCNVGGIHNGTAFWGGLKF